MDQYEQLLDSIKPRDQASDQPSDNYETLLESIKPQGNPEPAPTDNYEELLNQIKPEAAPSPNRKIPSILDIYKNLPQDFTDQQFQAQMSRLNPKPDQISPEEQVTADLARQAALPAGNVQQTTKNSNQVINQIPTPEPVDNTPLFPGQNRKPEPITPQNEELKRLGIIPGNFEGTAPNDIQAQQEQAKQDKAFLGLYNPPTPDQADKIPKPITVLNALDAGAISPDAAKFALEQHHGVKFPEDFGDPDKGGLTKQDIIKFTTGRDQLYPEQRPKNIATDFLDSLKKGAERGLPNPTNIPSETFLGILGDIAQENTNNSNAKTQEDALNQIKQFLPGGTISADNMLSTYDWGQKVLGENIFGKTLGIGTTMVQNLLTDFNMIAYGGKKAAQFSEAIPRALNGDLDSASKVLQGKIDVMPQLQPLVSASTWDNLKSDAMVEVRKDPANVLMIADAIASLGTKLAMFQLGRRGKPMPEWVLKSFGEDAKTGERTPVYEDLKNAYKDGRDGKGINLTEIPTRIPIVGQIFRKNISENFTQNDIFSLLQKERAGTTTPAENDFLKLVKDNVSSYEKENQTPEGETRDIAKIQLTRPQIRDWYQNLNKFFGNKVREPGTTVKLIPEEVSAKAEDAVNEVDRATQANDPNNVKPVGGAVQPQEMVNPADVGQPAAPPVTSQFDTGQMGRPPETMTAPEAPPVEPNYVYDSPELKAWYEEDARLQAEIDKAKPHSPERAAARKARNAHNEAVPKGRRIDANNPLGHVNSSRIKASTNSGMDLNGYRFDGEWFSIENEGTQRLLRKVVNDRGESAYVYKDSLHPLQEAALEGSTQQAVPETTTEPPHVTEARKTISDLTTLRTEPNLVTGEPVTVFDPSWISSNQKTKLKNAQKIVADHEASQQAPIAAPPEAPNPPTIKDIESNAKDQNDLIDLKHILNKEVPSDGAIERLKKRQLITTVDGNPVITNYGEQILRHDMARTGEQFPQDFVPQEQYQKQLGQQVQQARAPEVIEPSEGGQPAKPTAPPKGTPEQIAEHEQRKVELGKAIDAAVIKHSPVIERIRAAYKQINPRFQSAVKALADELGLKFKEGKIKETRRMAEKTEFEYNGDPTRVKDVVRNTIVAKNLADAYEVVKEIRKKFDVIGEVKNSFEGDQLPTGYADLKVIVDLGKDEKGQTLKGEIQVTTPELLKAKDFGGGHDLYKPLRELASLQSVNGSLTKFELAKLAHLESESRKIYEPARALDTKSKKSDLSITPESRSANEPILGGLESNKNPVAPPSSEGISAPGTPSPSTSKNLVPLGKTTESIGPAKSSGFISSSQENIPTEGNEVKLVEDAPRYFNQPEGTTQVPLDKVVTIRARPSGIANAEKYMAKAYESGGGKRDPIDLIDNGDGTYTVKDGNSTVAVARKHGWNEISARIVDKEGNPISEAKPPSVAQEVPPPSEPPVEPSGQPTEAPKSPTSIQNAVVDQEREARGLPPLMKEAQRDFGTVWNDALAKIDASRSIGKDAADDLIKDIQKKPRATTDEENAILLHKKIEVSNALDKVNQKILDAHESGDQSALVEGRFERARLEDSLVDIDEVSRTSGTELGRGLNARKMMANEDFSLAKMVVDKRAANDGRPLTDAEHTHIADLHKKINELQSDFAKYKAASEDRIAKFRVDEAIAKTKKTVPAAKPKTATILKFIDDQAASAMERIRARRGRAMAGLDPAEIADHVIVGASFIAKGAIKFGEWSARMVKEFGDYVKPHLQEIFDKATEEAKTMLKNAGDELAQQRDQILGGIKSAFSEGVPVSDLGRYVQKLAENFVGSGIVDREALIDSVHAELKKVIPDVTRREAMDAISGYGKFKPLSSDEISVQLRDLKGQMQQLGKLEDMQKGQPPDKTGMERRPVSDAERRLIQQVNEAKRKGGFNVTDPAKQLKTSLDAVKTNLKNQIKDLEFQIATGKKIVKEKTSVALDTEAESLKKQRDVLKQRFTEIFGKPELTDEQRIKIATGAVEKSIADLENRIKNNDLGPRTRESKTPNTPELEAARAKRDALKDQLQELRDLANPKKTPDEIANSAFKARTSNRIAELREKIANKDFSTKPHNQVNLDSEAMRLKADVERVKQQYNQELTKDKMKNRTGFEKTMDAVVKWRRAALLSGFRVLGKLTSAAVARIVITPAEEAIGEVLHRAFPKLSELAPRHGGGVNLRAEVKALTEGLTSGMRDAWQVLRTGHSELDLLYGKKMDLPQDFLDVFGNIHGALKAAVKRAEFARSFEKRALSYAKQGVDVTDEFVQTKIAIEAYEDASRSIFMQKNIVANAIDRGLQSLEEVNKTTGKVPVGKKALSTLVRVALPIKRVPTNIVAETMEYAMGTLTGSAKLAKAYREGISKLSPEEADLIMRHLKKGNLGAAVLLTGFLVPTMFGGFYQPGEKRKKGEIKADEARINGVDIPSQALHFPLAVDAQLGATIARVADSKLRKKDKDTQGLTGGAIAGALGLADSTPFIREMTEIEKLRNPQQRGKAGSAFLASLIIPQGIKEIAQFMDKDAEGNPIQREPTTTTEAIEAAVPGLRQNVPVKKPSR